MYGSSSLGALNNNSKGKQRKLEPLEQQQQLQNQLQPATPATAQLQASTVSTSTASSRKPFTKKDLTEAVRRLAASTALESAMTPGGSTKTVTLGGEPTGGSKASTPLAMMEWGVNLNARKFNELRTAADRKAAALKTKLETLRGLMVEQEALESMLQEDSPSAVRIEELLKAISVVQEETDRRLHFRRQLEHMGRRLQRNKVVLDSHLGSMDDAKNASAREHREMRGMLRTMEAGQTKAQLELAEAHREAAVERGERTLAMNQRRTEAEQASRMDSWRKARETARREFAGELAGDLSAEEERVLMSHLKQKKAQLASVRAAHELLQKEANSSEAAFGAVRQATGVVNSLDEVVEKFVAQQGNRKALTSEKKEAEDRLNNAKRAKESLETRFSELKASGIGSTEMNREIADQLEREITSARVELKASNAGCDRLEAVLVALRQGAVGLFQRLRPFGHLLEGEGGSNSILPTPAVAPEGGSRTNTPKIAAASSTTTTTTAAPPKEASSGNVAVVNPASSSDALSSIDSIDAIHLSEIMLSKMVEIIGGGGVENDTFNKNENKNDDAFEDILLGGGNDDSADQDALPNPMNNVRVRSLAQRRALDQQQYHRHHNHHHHHHHHHGKHSKHHHAPPESTLVVANDPGTLLLGEEDNHDFATPQEEEEEDIVATLVDSQNSKKALLEMVPTRNFLKLSSERQHTDILRRIENESRKKRHQERLANAAAGDRASLQSRAARQKAQSDANSRLSKAPDQKVMGAATTMPPFSKAKDSAVDRSVLLLTHNPPLS